MHSRRDLIKNIGIGAAAAAAGAGTSAVARAAHQGTLEAFAAGGTTRSAPWWLLSPIEQGSTIGRGWTVEALSRVERGAAVLELRHRGGEQARVHLCAHAGAPKGLASTVLFDLVLMDGGQGDQPTPEGLGRALLGVAARIRHNEMSGQTDLESISRMLTHAERVALYGPESLT